MCVDARQMCCEICSGALCNSQLQTALMLWQCTSLCCSAVPGRQCKLTGWPCYFSHGLAEESEGQVHMQSEVRARQEVPAVPCPRG